MHALFGVLIQLQKKRLIVGFAAKENKVTAEGANTSNLKTN